MDYTWGGYREYTRPKLYTRRDEIFQILVDYARFHKGNSPTQRGLWREVKRVRGQSMAYGVFIDHMDKLIKEGRVQRIDGELVIPESEWIFGT